MIFKNHLGKKYGKKSHHGSGGQGGKKGKKYYKNKGYKKKGFKNLYHKEEYGINNVLLKVLYFILTFNKVIIKHMLMNILITISRKNGKDILMNIVSKMERNGMETIVKSIIQRKLMEVTTKNMERVSLIL